MKLLDTIAAVSTPYGKGGVALIRISGKDAIQIAKKVFFPKSGKSLCDIPHARAVYGEIRSSDGVSVDDGVALCFLAPHSFTGEDTVEITCHGGILVTRSVLSCVLCAGARAAEAGEFTRRAYINGKMRLSEAEALGDLLEAKSDSQLSLARSGMRGALADKTEKIYLSLRRTMSSIWAAIDFPEEDLAEMSREQMISELESALDDIRRLCATYGTGRAINEGIPTVICGRTNAGKSSIYNKILGYDAAIVTDIEGTTRDVLRESATLGKTLLRLSDTAGLRKTDDRVESIGIERTRDAIREAGLVLAVFDSSRPLCDEDIELADEISEMGVPAIALLNKTDLNTGADMSQIGKRFSHVLSVSATSGEGFSALSELIDSLFIDGTIDVGSDAVVTGARQYAALACAAEALTASLEDLRADMPLDLCCVGIEDALSSLGEVDGRAISEEIVAEIFSRFCVGK